MTSGKIFTTMKKVKRTVKKEIAISYEGVCIRENLVQIESHFLSERGSQRLKASLSSDVI